MSSTYDLKVSRSTRAATIVLLVCMLIARELQKPILRKWGISENDVKQSIFYITLFMDIFLIGFNWEMALSIMAILIGKYIWLDCTFTDVVFFLGKILKAFRYLIESLFIQVVSTLFRSITPSKEIRRMLLDEFISLSLTIPYFEDKDKSDVADMICFSMMTTMMVFLLLFIMFCLLHYMCVLLRLNNN